MKELKCQSCGKMFLTKHLERETKFCSLKCFGLSIKGIKLDSERILKIIEGSKFRTTKYPREFICRICNKRFRPVQSRGKNGAKFCSQKCYGDSLRIDLPDSLKKAIRSKRWYDKNVEKIHQQRLRNRPKFLERERKYREKNKYLIMQNRQSAGTRFSNVRSSAKRRGLEFDITKEDFQILINSPCFYCLETELNRGLDRKDPKIGYVRSNVVPCCGRCNRVKWILTTDEFIVLCGKIWNNLNNYGKKKSI